MGHVKMSTLATNGLRANVNEILPPEHVAVAVASRGSVVRPNFDQATRCKGRIDMPNEHWKLAEKLVPTLRKLELATVLLRLAHSPKQHLMLFYTCYH